MMNKARRSIGNALPRNTKIKNYRIVKALNHGSFGIVYLAKSLRSGEKVVIKEYLPNDFGMRSRNGKSVVSKSDAFKKDYEWGLKSFLQEAQTVSQYREHPNIVTVKDFFTANNTAYMVMEYAGSVDLAQYLKKKKRLTPEQVIALLMPLLDALELIHSTGFVHRDIKPGNILISNKGEPILLDFGATRQSVGALSMDLTAIVSEGYAPWEQYQSKSKQGPFTDIYGLAATFYACMVGKKPESAPDRKGGVRIAPALEVCHDKYPEEILRMIDWGLMVEPTQRPQSIAEWVDILEGGDIPEDNPEPEDTSSKLLNYDLSSIKKIVPAWFHIPFWAGFLLLVLSYSFKNQNLAIATTLIGLVGVVVGSIYHYISLYRAWSTVQFLPNVTSPAKAVGFMFIPLFNFYWGFVAYPKLAENISSVVETQKLKLQPVNYGWSIALPVSNLVAFILSFFAPSLSILIWIIQGVITSYLINQWSTFLNKLKNLKYISL